MSRICLPYKLGVEVSAEDLLNQTTYTMMHTDRKSDGNLRQAKKTRSISNSTTPPIKDTVGPEKQQTEQKPKVTRKPLGIKRVACSYLHTQIHCLKDEEDLLLLFGGIGHASLQFRIDGSEKEESIQLSE